MMQAEERRVGRGLVLERWEGQVGSKKHVLIVDDEEFVLYVLREALAALGGRLEIALAADGREALRQIAEHPPDLLITDILLPGLDGVALTRALRAGPAKDTPVIWVTAHGSDWLREQAAALGVYRCLDKPVEIAAIRQAALEALQGD